MNVVPDASIVVKWFVPERDYEPARLLRDDYLEGRHDLIAPALLPFEVTNALRYTSFDDSKRLTLATESLAAYGLDLRSFARVGAVAEIAIELELTVYDASYLSLANEVDGHLYTADETLLSAVADTSMADRVSHIVDYG